MRIPIQTIPAYGQAYSNDRLAHVRVLAEWMDSRFEIPGTKIRFGIDPIVGFFLPGVGSVASSIVSLALISTMARHGASGNVIVRMLINVLLDTVFGSIPLIGSIFDVAFRANDRNVELLRRHYEEGRYQGSGRGLIALLLILVLGFCSAVVWGLWVFVEWFARLLGM